MPKGRSKNRIYPSLICLDAANRTVVACSDQVGIPRYLWNALPVTKILPGVVWFDEIPYHLQEIDRIVQEADLALVVGTSSTVRRAGEDHQIGHHLMIFLARYILLPVTHPTWRSTEARLLYSILTEATAIARQITFSWGHALKLCLGFSPVINHGLMTY